MPLKRRCLVCGNLIYSGFYCSDCSMEMLRSRTAEEESLEEWLRENRIHRNGRTEVLENVGSLDDFS